MACTKKHKTDDLFVGNALGAFARGLCDRMDNAITDVTGLSCSACYAIVQIGSEPHVPIEGLRKMLDLEHSSVVRLVNRLETQGLVDRTKGRGNDMRQVSLSLTHTGEDYFMKILMARRGVLKKVIAGFDEAEKEILIKIILKLAPNVVLPGDDQHVACRMCDLETCDQEFCPINQAYPDDYELRGKASQV